MQYNIQVKINSCSNRSEKATTFKYHVFATMGRFQLELIYLYFPPSSHLVYSISSISSIFYVSGQIVIILVYKVNNGWGTQYVEHTSPLNWLDDVTSLSANRWHRAKKFAEGGGMTSLFLLFKPALVAHRWNAWQQLNILSWAWWA